MQRIGLLGVQLMLATFLRGLTGMPECSASAAEESRSVKEVTEERPLPLPLPRPRPLPLPRPLPGPL